LNFRLPHIVPSGIINFTEYYGPIIIRLRLRSILKIVECLTLCPLEALTIKTFFNWVHTTNCNTIIDFTKSLVSYA